MQKIRSEITDKVEADLLKKIEWKSNFNTGIVTIDQEHKTLADLINKCILLVTNDGNDKKAIHAMLEKMVNYAHQHFDNEEQLLKQKNYPYFEDHQLEHQQFYGYLQQAYKKFNNNNLTAYELLKFLKDWFLNHMQDLDKDYVKYCKQE